jgi:Brp/Blh family beta-carotene 15,15'-monooxygenase
MFAVTPTLVGFAVYFCGWHSTRELVALVRRADPVNPRRGLRRVMVLAAPMAGLAVVATAAAAWWFSDGRELQPVVVQAVFLGLSAVAIPHILLHAVARFRRANPFCIPPVGEKVVA